MIKFIKGNSENPWIIREILESLGGNFEGSNFGHWLCCEKYIFTVAEDGTIKVYGNHRLDEGRPGIIKKVILSESKRHQVESTGEEIKPDPKKFKKVVYLNLSGYHSSVVSAVYSDKIIVADEITSEEFDKHVPEKGCLGYYTRKTGPKITREEAKKLCSEAFSSMI